MRFFVCIALCLANSGCWWMASPSTGLGFWEWRETRKCEPLIEAMQRYREREKEYPAQLDGLLEAGDLEQLPHIVHSFDPRKEPTDALRYMRGEREYLLSFHLPEHGLDSCWYYPSLGWECGELLIDGLAKGFALAERFDPVTAALAAFFGREGAYPESLEALAEAGDLTALVEVDWRVWPGSDAPPPIHYGAEEGQYWLSFRFAGPGMMACSYRSTDEWRCGVGVY